MTEDKARGWIAERFGADSIGQLQAIADMVVAECREQNLISAATLDQIWNRHILDSAQLIPLAPAAGRWLDIGTGAGFPGMVVAVLRRQPTMLVEPRRRRAEFLQRCVEGLGLTGHVHVIASKVEVLTEPADIISARAVASIEKLLQSATACAKVSTRWLLPRGRLEDAELAQLRQRWAGMFHVEHSLTDAGSSILVAEQVRRR